MFLFPDLFDLVLNSLIFRMQNLVHCVHGMSLLSFDNHHVLPWFDLLFSDPFCLRLIFGFSKCNMLWSVHDTCLISLDNHYGITTHHISCPWFFSFRSFFTASSSFLWFFRTVSTTCVNLLWLPPCPYLDSIFSFQSFFVLIPVFGFSDC